MNRTKAPTRRGFWLVESAIAIAVIGIGIVAVAGSHQSWHQQQVVSAELATGMRLAKEIREMTLILPSSDPITGTGVWDNGTYTTDKMYSENGAAVAKIVESLGTITEDAFLAAIPN